MVEIRYKDYYEVADLAGKSLADVRKDYKSKFDIPDRARAKLNDKKVELNLESEIRIHDCDEVCFATERSGKWAFLVGASLLALAIAGATFAYGYTSNTVTLGVTSVGGDFASITVAPGQPSWTVHGQAKGGTGSGNLFVVDTSTSNYPGDMAVTVYIANVDQLVKVYKVLTLNLQAASSNGTQIDINTDGIVDANDSVLLTLNNAEASFYIKQSTSSDNYTIRLNSGYYVANAHPVGGWEGSAQPMLYAEVVASGIPNQTGTPNQYALTVNTSGQGSVNQNPPQTSYGYGTVVTLTAIPAPGWSFDHWSGDLSGNTNPATITMTGNKTVTASFAINTYTITASAGAHGLISPSGAVTVNDGADQAFTITANSDYHIADVLVDGSSVGAVTSYTFHNVTADHTIAASFAITGPAITVTSPNGGESWAVGSTQTITWASAGVTGHVKIQLSRNGGTTWTTIISSTPNDGSQAWKVTWSATTQARIKIVSVYTPTIFDISDANFTISH